MAGGGARPHVSYRPLVQQLLDPPKIRRLPHEGAPIPQAGKPRHPMPFEITPDRLVAVMTQQLPDDLQGDHFAIARAGSKPTGAQFHPADNRLKPIFHPTKHRDDKLFQRHG